MSIRIYRLLRNNKEEGPFTSEELTQKILKPYDLIWINGRSAAWNYPAELPEFKKYVPLPGENLINQNNQKTPAVTPSVQAAIAVNNTIAQPVHQQKPRYKVSAAWNKIQTVTVPVYKNVMIAEPKKASPKKMVEAKQPEDAQSKSLSWEEAWLDWEKEKTVEPIYKPVNAPQKKANKNSAPVLETKYAEPLDSLKDKYIENILQQKKKSNKSFSLGKASEFIIPSVALLIIFSAAYWLLHKTNATTTAVSPTTIQATQPVVTSNTNEPIKNVTDNVTAPASSETVTNEDQNITPVNEPALTHAEDRKIIYAHPVKLATNKQVDHLKPQNDLAASPIALPVSKSTTQKPVEQTAKQSDSFLIKNVPKDNANNNPANTDATINPSTQKAETVAPKSIIKSTATYVSVPEYIEMAGGSANVKIQNISDVNLDLVVIDVQYFDAYKHFRKGETFYLHNLRAGRNVIVKTPKDTNSLYATSKVSLVSSDANNVYVIGDN